ncbi:MAG: GNAT family N-acetyltransferase, partial [Rhodanobacter sp.]
VVGHYRIDPDARSVAGYELMPPTLGLRAFFIDARWQGQGLGKAAVEAMLADLVRRHPGTRQLALCVGADNCVARRLYLHAGFVESGELYHDGRGQAQHLLLRTLP